MCVRTCDDAAVLNGDTSWLTSAHRPIPNLGYLLAPARRRRRLKAVFAPSGGRRHGG